MLTNSQSQISSLINRYDSICRGDRNTSFCTVSRPESRRINLITSIFTGDTEDSTDGEDPDEGSASGASYALGVSGDLLDKRPTEDHAKGYGSGEHWNQKSRAPTSGQRSAVRKCPRVLKCLMRKCKRKRFKRQQEFVRHVATRRMTCSSFGCRFLTCNTDLEVNRRCPSCSARFQYASTFGTHKCDASAEKRKEIKQAYDEMLTEVKVQLGLSRIEYEGEQEVPGLAPEPGSGAINHQRTSMADAIGPGNHTSQTGLETEPLATHLEGIAGYGHIQPASTQLYDLFGDTLHSNHYNQLSGYQSLWNGPDSTSSLVIDNMILPLSSLES